MAVTNCYFCLWPVVNQWQIQPKQLLVTTSKTHPITKVCFHCRIHFIFLFLIHFNVELLLSERVLLSVFPPAVVPDAPDAPDVSNITVDSMCLSWSPPLHDGGAPVSGYVVEMRQTTSPRWVKATLTPTPDTTFKVSYQLVIMFIY